MGPIQIWLQKKNTPPELARAGVEDGSSADNPVTNAATEQTTSLMISIPEAPTSTAGCKLQNCICGLTKVTSNLGLKIPPGQERVPKEQGPARNREVAMTATF